MEASKNLDLFARLRGWAAPELIDFLNQMALLLPEELKYRLKQVMDSLPEEGDNMQKVLEVVRGQWKDIQYDQSIRIAVVGPARTGKSSLISAIRQEQEESDSSIFSLADSQGLEEYLGFGSRSRLPEEVGKADAIVLVLDGRYGLTDMTYQMYDRLRRLQRPVLVVLSKMDLVDRRGQTVRQAKRKLGTNVIPVSLAQPGSVEAVLKAIVAANPKALYPLCRNFPGFRRSICDGIVTQAAFASALVGAVPIPVSDMLPMSAIQTAMILKIARAFGYHLNRERARELLPALLAGVLVREGSHRLRGRFPGQRELIAVAVAGFWTYALGKAAIGYFEKLSASFEKAEPLLFRAREADDVA